MTEKKKSHKSLPKQYTLTICQSDLDMLESAIISGAGVARWRPQVRGAVPDGAYATSVGFDSGYRGQ